MNSPAPGWLPDPTSRHEYRYWDGARWTDDVADGGVAATDALGQPAAPAAEPSPTASDPTQPVDPTHQYPGVGQQPMASPYYGDYHDTGQAPPEPPKRRPPTALLAALAVLAVALIGGLVYFLVRDDDNGSSDSASQVSGTDSTTTEGENPNSSGNSGDDNSDSGSSDGTLPDDIDSENVDELVEFMADNMEQASGGVLDHEQATCISQGLLDELGFERLVDIGDSGENVFTDPDMTSQLFRIIEDCGVSLADLATAPD